MNQMESMKKSALKELCKEYLENNQITKNEFETYRVKRGLRNDDGTGVMAGLTHVCNVHGYIINDGDREPDTGRLIYRGIDVRDIVRGCEEEKRFGFEEVVWLLVFGTLPDAEQLKLLSHLLYKNRELPSYFLEDTLMKAPPKNIMNKMASAVISLYAYDDEPEGISLENNIRQSIALIAGLPAIMTQAYQVKQIGRAHV